MAGIHRGAEGAYSIALSGGYDDNIDLGDCFTYTGEGNEFCISEPLHIEIHFLTYVTSIDPGQTGIVAYRQGSGKPEK